MKLLIALLILVSSYVYILMRTSDFVLGQTQQLNRTYQYVANHSEDLANPKF